MKVFVYFNLHKKIWSIRALSGPRKGLVIAHAQRVNLIEATFKVSEAGRQRVLAEKRKNVHAGIVGTWDGHGNPEPWEGATMGVPVSYNPYKAPTFTRRDDSSPVHKATLVHLGTRSATAYNIHRN